MLTGLSQCTHEDTAHPALSKTGRGQLLSLCLLQPGHTHITSLTALFQRREDSIVQQESYNKMADTTHLSTVLVIIKLPFYARTYARTRTCATPVPVSVLRPYPCRATPVPVSVLRPYPCRATPVPVSVLRPYLYTYVCCIRSYR